MESQSDAQSPEKVELTPEEIKLTTEAVATLTMEHDPKSAANFLKEHPNCIFEFCLQVVDRYQEDDRYTPALEIASVVEAMLEK